ncbi:hypothetical protein AB4Y55_24130 [Serratia nematodiphila]
MITVKRYNPDAAMSISREHAWMRETPEGGHVEYGDYASLFAQFELVKAERDALADRVERLSGMLTESRVATKSAEERVDAMAVENAALKSRSIKLFNLGYLHGHESTVEGYFVDVHRNDIDTYHDDVVTEIIEGEDETPATSAALAAIEARGVEKAAAALDALSAQSASATTQANFRAAAVYLRAEVLPAIGEAK